MFRCIYPADPMGSNKPIIEDFSEIRDYYKGFYKGDSRYARGDSGMLFPLDLTKPHCDKCRIGLISNQRVGRKMFEEASLYYVLGWDIYSLCDGCMLDVLKFDHESLKVKFFDRIMRDYYPYARMTSPWV